MLRLVLECGVSVVIIMFPRQERTGGPVVSLAKLGHAGGERGEGGRQGNKTHRT